ncbi:MAG: hypothetical protein ACRDKJ_09185 [Actinomycetota bacterium]
MTDPERPDPKWSGCHGVRLGPQALAEGYGRAVGEPLVDAELTHGPVGEAGRHELWHLAGELTVAGERVSYDQRLTRHDDGSYRLHAQGAGLQIDPRENHLILETDRESLARQLVTTYGIPLLLLGHPALTLHACAAIPPGEEAAIVVCGTSGTGKSTLTVGLLTAGWTAVSEDLSVIDLRHDSPTVWPGPPWVRRDGEGPPGSVPRFTTADKTAWDIAPWQVARSTPIQRIVFMDRASGDSVAWEPLDRADVIPRLVRLTSWLGDPSERANETFTACVRVAGAAPAARLRLPVGDDWVERAEAALLGDRSPR